MLTYIVSSISKIPWCTNTELTSYSSPAREAIIIMQLVLNIFRINSAAWEIRNYKVDRGRKVLRAPIARLTITPEFLGTRFFLHFIFMFAVL